MNMLKVVKKMFASSNIFAAAGVFLVIALLPACQTTQPGSSEKKISETVASVQSATKSITTMSGVKKMEVDLTGRVPHRRSSLQRAGRPLSNFVSKNFLGSDRCAICHELLTDKDGNDMSISNHWRSTMMANAAKDPLWQAKVSSEVSRNPALREVIEKKCTICHMPMAWQQFMASNPDKYIQIDDFLDRSSSLHEAAMEGVSCTLCHQVRDVNMGEKESFGGNITIDMDKGAPEREIFGPYRDVFQKLMIDSVGYSPVYGAHINDSAICATCHTLFTPYVDGEGNVLGEFPEQTPYLEWLHSEYAVPVSERRDIDSVGGKGILCQDCHMPHSKAGGVIVARYAPPEVTRKDHFSQHHFVGGNVFMLNILQDNGAALKLTASTDKLEDTKQRTILQLQSDTADVFFTGIDWDGRQLTASVEVDNKVGHKFPTGFPSRRAWLHFTVTDSEGKRVFESGRPMADGGIEGDAGEEGLQSFEPHYEIINSPDQVQIYETVMTDSDGKITWTLLRAAKYLKDNRLLPRGFAKDTASPDIAVYGTAASDNDFVGGSDQIVYQVDLNPEAAPFVVEVELLYTSVSNPFMKDLQKDNHTSPVRRFENLYERADKTPVSVAAAAVRLAFP
jgi:hypothetical protein